MQTAASSVPTFLLLGAKDGLIGMCVVAHHTLLEREHFYFVIFPDAAQGILYMLKLQNFCTLAHIWAGFTKPTYFDDKIWPHLPIQNHS